jgi:hypothetical protein
MLVIAIYCAYTQKAKNKTSAKQIKSPVRRKRRVPGFGKSAYAGASSSFFACVPIEPDGLVMQ